MIVAKMNTATEGVRPWLLLSKMGELRIYSTGDRRTRILIGGRRMVTPVFIVAPKFLILKRLRNSPAKYTITLGQKQIYTDFFASKFCTA
jgi:hypothetical protein